jgi:hypothetical protein
MKWQVAQVPPEAALSYLYTVRRLMEEHTYNWILLYTADDIIRGVMDGKLALIIFYEHDHEDPFLFAAIRLDTYPQGRAATVIALAGRYVKAAVEWSPNFEEWCRMQGCTHIYFNTHPKLAKILERKGYRTRSVAVYKPLMTLN